MDFDKTTVLGSSTQYEYFGSNLYNYRKIKTVSLEGFLIDEGVIEGDSEDNKDIIDGFLDTTTIQEFTVNGTAFGTGKLVDISFSDEGVSPGLKQVSATIEVYEGGIDPDSGGGGGSSEGLQSVLIDEASEANFLVSLDEVFSFNETASNKSFNYSVNINYQDDESNDPLLLSKTLAQALIDEALANQLIDGYNEDATTYKKYCSESIDEISKSYSLSHQYNFVDALSSGSTDSTSEISVAINQNGITTVSEKGVVRFIAPSDESSLGTLNTETQALIDSSFTRCQTEFNIFIADEEPTAYSSPASLVDKKISVIREIDERNLTINYTVNYSNDISIESTYNWSYNHEIKKSEGFYVISERGQIVGDGKPLPIGSECSIEKAKSAFNDTIKGGIEGRIDSVLRSNTIEFREIHLINEDTNFSEIDGTITYNFSYSSESREGTDKITNKNTVTHSYPVDLKNNFNILKDMSISQKLDLATIGKTTLRMELRGEKEVTFSEYRGFINTTISKFIPTEEFVHISSSPKISFTPKKNSMTFSVEWNWLREVADIDVI
tara:strand:+ start:7869 stop:9527 length:1659 start_codon:yes stop_codon:yes gene_type:complete